MTAVLRGAAVALTDAEHRFGIYPDVLARRALRRAEVTLARAVANQANATHPNGEPT